MSKVKRVRLQTMRESWTKIIREIAELVEWKRLLHGTVRELETQLVVATEDDEPEAEISFRGAPMTLDDFHNLTRERIPTAAEFVELTRSMGWSIGKREGKAFLRAPATNPVALSLAKMLGREPYRTNVLEIALRADYDVSKECRPDIIAEAPEPRGEWRGHR